MYRLILLWITALPLYGQVWQHEFHSQITDKSYQIQTDVGQKVVQIDQLAPIPFHAFQASLVQLNGILQTERLEIVNERLVGWKKGAKFEIPLDVWENVQMEVGQEVLKQRTPALGGSVDEKGIFGFFNVGYWLFGFCCLLLGGFALVFYLRRIKRQQRLAEQRRLEAETMRNDLLKDFEIKTKVMLAEIHDGPLQDLARFSRQLSSTEKIEGRFSDYMAQTKAGIEQVAQDLRHISANITPTELSDIGLDSAMRTLLRRFQIRNPKLKITASFDKEGLKLAENTRLMLYRIFQEALNNVEKHAQATTLNIGLSIQDNRCILEVRDNGVGFDKESLKTSEEGIHLGFSGIQSRCENIGAGLTIKSEKGQGTSLAVHLNLKGT